MATKNLTDRGVQALRATKTQQEYFDSGFKVRGIQFGVRVSPAGAKEYFVRYRNRVGKKRYLSLGDVQGISLADAHEEACKVKSKIKAGEDPAQEKEALRAAETFKELTETYINIHAKPNKRPRSVKEDERIISTYLLSYFGDYKAAQVRRKDIITLLDDIAVKRDAPTQAARVRALIHKIFAFAVEREILDANPCTGLPRLKKSQPRERVLSDNEIKKLWKALDKEKEPVASFYRVLLLTGQRPGEVAGMRWDEIAGEIWTIPAGRTKNGRPQRIPLTKKVKEILSDLEKHNALAKAKAEKRGKRKDLSIFDEFVFPTRGGPIRWLQTSCKRLVDEMKTDHFTPHDLRRTTATKMRELKVSREVVEKILNHAVQGAIAHYDHASLTPEIRRALEKWARYVDRVISGKAKTKSEKVVKIR